MAIYRKFMWGNKMDEFLKTWYGLYPQWLDQNHFICQQQQYEICDCFLNEKQVKYWLQINERMILQLGTGGYLLIPNLQGQLVTQHKAVFLNQSLHYHINDLFKQNQMTFPSKKTLLEVREKWIEKTEFASQRFLFEIDCHQEQYPIKATLVQYHIGLAKTAITVLNDVIYDYPAPLLLNQLCHRRLPRLEAEIGMHPFNFILDHRARDLCELFMHQLIDFDALCHSFDQFHYTAQELHYFFARLLFPSWFFDEIEHAFFQTQQLRDDEHYFIDQLQHQQNAIIQVHHFLSEKMNLKPLEW